MSSDHYITSIAIFSGAQGKFYVVDGYKYHTRFPIEWALDHKTFITGKRKQYKEGTGPKECGNCRTYGSIRDVFVGYCGTCLNFYKEIQQPRGIPYGGWDINDLGEESIVEMYPYMTGVKASEIGDVEDSEEEDQHYCVHLHE